MSKFNSLDQILALRANKTMPEGWLDDAILHNFLPINQTLIATYNLVTWDDDGIPTKTMAHCLCNALDDGELVVISKDYTDLDELKTEQQKRKLI